MIKNEPDARVKSEAVEAYCALGETAATSMAAQFFIDRDPLIRRGAVVGLMKNSSPEGVLAADQQLSYLGKSLASAERSLAAEIMGQLGFCRFTGALLELLRDKDFNVRKSALKAAGKVRDPGYGLP